MSPVGPVTATVRSEAEAPATISAGEDRPGGGVGEALDGDAVAGAEEELRGDEDRLLRAVRDDDLAGGEPPDAAQVPAQLAKERLVAARLAVVEQRRPAAAKGFAEGGLSDPARYAGR